jgi:WD40 repeat protein
MRFLSAAADAGMYARALPAQVYHTPRMQRVFAVRFSADGSYVFSGSDDMNVRVWKARALPRSFPYPPLL